MLPSPQTAPTSSPLRKFKRPRAIQACNFCRSKKYKCDGALPCGPCQKHSVECVFRSLTAPNAGVSYSPSYVKDLERRLEAAERIIAQAKLRNIENLPYRSPSSLAEPSEISPTTSRDFRSTSFGRATEQSGSAPSTAPIATGEAVELTPPELREDITDDGETEVVNVIPQTRAIEFHGNSSSITFLDRVRQEYSDRSDDKSGHLQPESAESTSLVSAIHNSSFSPGRQMIMEWNDGAEERLFSPQLYVFVDTYFNNLHYIHPIIDQTTFLRRCNDLWSGHPERQTVNFIALYFAVLSLGALIRTWTEEKINGMGRFEWSRMLFEKADMTLGKPGHFNDLEAIQTLFTMAKVCQNELNPNLAYIYLGMAIRAALATGMNRNALMQGCKQSNELDSAISKTWWGLYTLEIELSFALGRPDTLGMEDYHNRPKPPVDNTEISILTSMIGLSRIMRQTSICIYLSRSTVTEKLIRAFQIEAEINAWVESLPECIRPSLMPGTQRNNSLRDPIWARMQRLVLQIRYYNVTMLLLRPFLLHASKMTSQGRTLPVRMDEAISKCTNAAISTIETIYETCRLQTYFRTWWYNTTYLTFAASILLFRIAERPPESASPKFSPDGRQIPYLPYIEKTLDVLDMMDESVVALKTADIMRQMLSRLAERSAATYVGSGPSTLDSPQKRWPPIGHDGTFAIRGDGFGTDNLGFPIWDLGAELGIGHEKSFPGLGVDMFFPG